MRRNNSLKTTSFSRVTTSTSSLLSLRENGLRLVESSTTRQRPSLCGSMRKISLELSPCSPAPISAKSSRDSPAQSLALRRRPSLLMMSISVTLPHALPTLEPASVPPSTSDFPSSETRRISSRLSLTSTMFRSEVPTVSTPRLMTTSTIFPTSVDSAALRSTLFKICTMVSRP